MRYINSFLKGIVFILLVMVGTSTFAHKYHISHTSVSHNSELQVLEIICRVHIYDLETIAKKKYKITNLDFSESEDGNTNSFVSEYMKEHIKINADKNALELNVLGYQIDGDEVEIFIEAKINKLPEELEISHTILTDLFEDQQNIIKCEINNTPKSATLSKKKPKVIFRF